MSEKSGKEEKPALACDVCLKDIEPGDAETYEVDDYVHHFCGLDCYSEWQKKKPSSTKENE
jgi:hypothetical protein